MLRRPMSLIEGGDGRTLNPKPGRRSSQARKIEARKKCLGDGAERRARAGAAGAQKLKNKDLQRSKV